jgi:hypothetical protein
MEHITSIRNLYKDLKIPILEAYNSEYSKLKGFLI